MTPDPPTPPTPTTRTITINFSNTYADYWMTRVVHNGVAVAGDVIPSAQVAQTAKVVFEISAGEDYEISLTKKTYSSDHPDWDDSYYSDSSIWNLRIGGVSSPIVTSWNVGATTVDNYNSTVNTSASMVIQPVL